MSLKPQTIDPIPSETARVARMVFPSGALAMQMRDELRPMYDDQLFADLFPTRGQLAEAPWRSAFVTVLQFIEGLSDRQAAQAVRRGIEWKHALSLELTGSGFHFSVLSEFRSRLIAGQAEERLLTTILEVFKARGWLKARGRQRSDSTHVLASIRTLNRLETVGETLCYKRSESVKPQQNGRNAMLYEQALKEHSRKVFGSVTCARHAMWVCRRRISRILQQLLP